MKVLVTLNQIELSVTGVQVRWEHGPCCGKERCPGAEIPTWRPLFSLLHLLCPPQPQSPLPSFALRPFSLPFPLVFLCILCCLPLQEYIRRQLEEEQRQLEILQQQLLHEQALLLVMGMPSPLVCSVSISCVCVCGLL